MVPPAFREASRYLLDWEHNAVVSVRSMKGNGKSCFIMTV